MTMTRLRRASTSVLLALSLLLVPLGTAHSAPPAAAGQMTVTGVLDFALASNPGRGNAPERYFLTDQEGRSWNLRVPPGLAAPFRGTEVTVSGRALPTGTFQVTSIEGDATASGMHTTHPQSGSKPFLTLPCRFADVAATPQDVAFFENLLSDQPNGADHYWQEVSYGIINLEGSEVRDWQDLAGDRDVYVDDEDEDNQGAKLNDLAVACVKAHLDAANADPNDDGFNLGDFFGINLMFNADLDCCAWGGSSTPTGGDSIPTTWMPPWAWDLMVMAHEMGHSFGLPHSSGPFDATYDSNWDVMSGGPRPIPSHTIAWHKGRLGWIDHTRRFEWNGSDNVRVDLERVAMPTQAVNPEGNNAILAVIPIPGGNTFYTAEARLEVGYDENIPGEAVVLHHVDPARGDRTAQVVVAPGGTSPNGAAAQWVPGERFEDLENDIAIEVLGRTSSGFSIVINPPVVADVRITKSASPSTAIAGEQLEYILNVSNAGPGTAREVVVTDTLPDGVSFVAAAGNIGADTCSAAGQVVTCDLEQLKSGASRQIRLTVQVSAALVASAGAPTTITNVAEVSQAEEIVDPDQDNNTATVTTLVNDRADLATRKDCKPDGPLSAGDTGTCTLYVDNFGPSDARSVQLVDQIISDGQFRVVGVTSPCSASPGLNTWTGSSTVTCNFGTRTVGTSVALVEVDVTANEGMDINNTVTVTSDSPDPDSGNNQASDSLEVQAESDLEISKSAPETVVAGEELTYLLTVANGGPSTATNVVVEDWLPAGVSVDSIHPSRGSCQAGVPGDANRPTRCTLGTLAPFGTGSSATISITVLVAPSTSGALHNDAAVSSDVVDPDNSNDSATWTTDVDTAAELTLTKVATPDPVVAGEKLSFVLTVGNDGPSDAQDVVVLDDLDSRLDWLDASVVNGLGTCALVTGGATTGGATDAVRCELRAPLAPGDTATIHLDTLVAADVSEGAEIANVATATSTTQGDPAVANSTTEVITVADVQVAKEVNVEIGNSSSTIEYDLLVTNEGPSDAQAVYLVDDLPSITTGKNNEKVVLLYLTPGCEYTPTTSTDPHVVECDIGTLAAGDSVSFRILLELKGNGTLDNTVTITSNTSDPNVDNNVATTQTIIGGGGGGGGGGGNGGGNGGGKNK